MRKGIHKHESASSPVSHHEAAQQAYYEQELSSILSTTEEHASPASRTMSQWDIDACKIILQECPEICQNRLRFGRRIGYGVHTSHTVFPLLQLCYRQAPLELIEMAYDAHPDAISDNTTQDSGSFTALHWACCGTFTSLEVVQLLVEKNPTSMYHVSWGHRTLLHHACENGSAAEIVRLLLEHCPHHTRERDNHQNVPLHLACGRPVASMEVVKLLTEFDLTTVELTSQLGLMNSHTSIIYQSGSVYNSLGYTALHYACGEGAPLDVVRLLVRQYPAALWLHASGMALPLHLACSKQFPSLETISFLVGRYPRALQLSTSDGCSGSCGGGGNPLQLSAKSKPSLAVVRFLYEQYPASLGMSSQSQEPNLALRYACWNGASSEVIGYLLEKANLIHPGTIPRASNAETLLHSTCSKAVSHSLIPSMLERFPDDIQRASITGDLPLHAACRSRAPLVIIRLLVSKYPKAVCIPNNDGDLPLHLNVKRRVNVPEKMIDVTLLRFLVEQNVEGLERRNYQNITPFDLALEFLFPGPSPSPRQSYISHATFHEEMMLQSPMEILRILTPRAPKYLSTSRFGEVASLPVHYIVSHPRLLFDAFHNTNSNAVSRVQTILSYMCQKDPEACHRVNDLVETPLHIASATNGISLATIEFLFAEDADAIQTPNREGLYPFELAAAVSDNNTESDLESLGVVYFLVHRSLFAFENLTRWRDHDFLHSHLCNLENNDDDESIKKATTSFQSERRRYQQQTLAEILERRETTMNARLDILETELLQLKRKQQEEDVKRAQSSCCIIS